MKYMNATLTSWFYNKQLTEETSVFDPELAVTKQGVDTQMKISYNLIMMAVQNL